MIEAYFGEYHSGLELHFLDKLKYTVQNRADELTQKIFVVVPSSYLKEYLVKRFFESADFAAVNVYFITLDGLAKSIFNDIQQPFYVIDNDVFFAKLLQEQLRKKNEKFFQYIGKSYGASLALYNSIKDLYEANLSPKEFADLIEFIKIEDTEQDIEKRLGHRDWELLQNVVQSYDIFYNAVSKKYIFNNFQLMQFVSKNLAATPLIENILAIFWYGFYDATQTQFDFIEAITRKVIHNEANVYFYSPIDVKDNHVIEECRYAKIFYQDLMILINSLGKDNVAKFLPISCGKVSKGIEYCIIKESDTILPTSNSGISILSCNGPYEEVWVCVKEILTLIEKGHYTFDDIAVVARTMEPYSFYIDILFKENNIPFWGELHKDALLNPIFRFMLNILYGCLNNLPTDAVLEIISNPYYKYSKGVDIQEVKHVLEKLYIKNKGDWERLKALCGDFDSAFVQKFLGEGITHERLEKVVDVLEKLRSVLSGIVSSGTIYEIANSFFTILKDHFIYYEKEEDVKDVLDSLATKFIPFNYLDEKYDLEEFICVFEEILKSIPEKNKSDRGVLVCDVMKFRGLSYKVIFVLGMNKDIFPREIVPEPFISDSIRYKIDYLAGRKIKQKRRMAIKEMGYDEEFILFYYILKAAADKVYLIYQRADAKGNLSSPSYYLERINYFLTECQKDVPKDIIGKYNYYKGISGFLPSKNELSVLLSISDNSEDVLPLWFKEQYGMKDAESYLKTIVDFANKINSKDECTEVDGFLTNRAKEILKYLKNESGKILFSQSALSAYKKCPFMFFAERVLKIGEIEEEEKKEFVSMRDMGNMIDVVLKYYFKKKKQFDSLIDKQILKESISYTRNMYKNLLNPIQLDYALNKVEVAVTNFLSDKTYDGYKITVADDEITKAIDGKDIVLTGIPDAIFSKSDETVIVDFKFGGRKYSGSESRLYNEGLLQFVIYPLVYVKENDTIANISFKYENLAIYLKYKNLSYLEEIIKSNGFEDKIVTKKGEKLSQDFLDTFGRFSDGVKISEYWAEVKNEIIQRGILASFFIIHRDAAKLEYNNICNYCDFFLMCRRTHLPTQKRIFKKWGELK